MSVTQTAMSGPITTGLSYLERKGAYTEPGGAPYYINYPIDEVPQTNTCHQQHQVVVQDVRPGVDKLDLDVHGFQMFRHCTSLDKQEFEDDSIVRAKYYAEVEALLKNILGASQIVVWEHTPRLRRPEGAVGIIKWCHRASFPYSVVLVFVEHLLICKMVTDQTPDAARERVRRTLANSEHLLKSRVQIINVWRPLSGPVNDYPLALGDARTFDLHRDGIATCLVFPHYVGQATELHHHVEHRWYYLSEQQNDEIWVFKCYDSRTDVATGAPHCSFDIQQGRQIHPPRESIEVRCMVFYEDKA